MSREIQELHEEALRQTTSAFAPDEPVNRLRLDAELAENCIIRFHDGDFRIYSVQAFINYFVTFRVRIDTTPEQRFDDIDMGQVCCKSTIRPASLPEIHRLIRHLDWPYQVLARLVQPCAKENRIKIIR